MKKINVLLRVSKKSHPLYEELFNNPPNKINYINSQKIEHYSSKEGGLRKIKLFFWKVFTKFFPASIPMNYPNADIIHSTNNILPISKTPWVIDTEMEYGVFGFNFQKHRRTYYNFFLKNIFRQKSFKKIIAWSNICKEGLIEKLGEEFKEKVEVVYPAHKIIPLKKKQPQKKEKRIELLFVARIFQNKGGYELLDSFELLKRKKNCRLTIISNPSDKILSKYSNREDIRFIKANLKRKELAKYFKNADIFVYPTRIDTFGFVLIEAMAHSLPVISTDHYAIPEIVKNKVSGFLIKPALPYENKSKWLDGHDYLRDYQQAYLKDRRYVIELTKKMDILISNKKLREKMGRKGFEEVASGKFSITERNKRLSKIYRECLR